MDNHNGYKIFVGNVPYCCNQYDFENIFKNMEGFLNAEIVIANSQNKNSFSRGFGFVTMKTKEYADILKQKNDIMLKGRILRFTEYQTDIIDRQKITNNQQKYNEQYNYLLIDHIPSNKDKLWLKNTFINYGPIGKCFIMMNQNTGVTKNIGIVEILDDDKYKDLLSKRWYESDNILLELSKYNRLQKN